MEQSNGAVAVAALPAQGQPAQKRQEIEGAKPRATGGADGTLPKEIHVPWQPECDNAEKTADEWSKDDNCNIIVPHSFARPLSFSLPALHL
jgi:hypothetical protein